MFPVQTQRSINQRSHKLAFEIVPHAVAETPPAPVNAVRPPACLAIALLASRCQPLQ
jgi:hypothetical protein